MSVTLGLLSLALLGADNSPKAARPIQYHVRVVEMNGLEWRESLYAKLTPVTKQGTATIWTAQRDVVRPLLDQASRVVLSPQVMAQSDAAAHYSQKTSRRVVSKLTRLADGPYDHAVAVAYTPDYEDVRDGCQFTITGRKLDQGVLAKIVVDESQVSAVHQVKLSEVVPAQDSKTEPGKITPSIEVPEVVSASVAGEWLIPQDGVLLVSFGARTIDDGQGKAVVKERLMLVEATESGKIVTRTGFERIELPRVKPVSIQPPVILAPAAAPQSLPVLPSRSLPQGKNADGTVVPLPPLPDEPPPTSLPDSSEPCATPQTRDKISEKSERTVDPASMKTSFLSDPMPFLIPDAATRLLFSTIKPLLFKVPLSAGVTIEIRASMSPSLKP